MVNITCVQENIVKDQEKVNQMHPFEISALQGYKSQFIVLKKLRNNAKDQFRKNLLQKKGCKGKAQNAKQIANLFNSSQNKHPSFLKNGLNPVPKFAPYE